MTPILPDHYAISSQCRRKAEAELEQDDLLTAAEMMWGAVVHAIKLVIPQYANRPLHSHRDMQRAVQEAAPYLPYLDLRQYFGHGEVLHRYFYRLDIPEHQSATTSASASVSWICSSPSPRYKIRIQPVAKAAQCRLPQ